MQPKSDSPSREHPTSSCSLAISLILQRLDFNNRLTCVVQKDSGTGTYESQLTRIGSIEFATKGVDYIQLDLAVTRAIDTPHAIAYLVAAYGDYLPDITQEPIPLARIILLGRNKLTEQNRRPGCQ